MQDAYAYPAVFTSDEDGVAVEFPDLPGCLTCADNEQEALRKAREVLSWHLWDREREGEPIPVPSSMKELVAHLEKDEHVVTIEVFMPPCRHVKGNKAAKSTTFF